MAESMRVERERQRSRGWGDKKIGEEKGEGGDRKKGKNGSNKKPPLLDFSSHTSGFYVVSDSARALRGKAEVLVMHGNARRDQWPHRTLKKLHAHFCSPRYFWVPAMYLGETRWAEQYNPRSRGSRYLRKWTWSSHFWEKNYTEPS